MAYDEFLADRIRNCLKEKNVEFSELRMMGGLCFKVDDKMLCGIHRDKKLDDNLLMARIGEEAYEQAIEREECLPMDFTGRPMKGYTFVTPQGFDLEDDLEYWIQLCLDFNPQAKSSKKRKK
ncbi:MAG: RNA methyltransferase [Bacteroidetes bacterium]|nr:MAG: RNA methyltransferase [Bacteroidota bacterium]